MSFGAAVRQRRCELKIGLIDFADRIGISAAYWSRIERDCEKPPHDELIERAAAALGLGLDELFARAENVSPDTHELAQVVTFYRPRPDVNPPATGVRKWASCVSHFIISTSC